MSGTDLASIGATGGMTGSCMGLIVVDGSDTARRIGFQWVEDDPRSCPTARGGPILDR